VSLVETLMRLNKDLLRAEIPPGHLTRPSAFGGSDQAPVCRLL
jgi:hypothetical protein